MSVKFRCQYCDQMLGIAASKIGEIIDCPGCGRSICVPENQGTAIATARGVQSRSDSKPLHQDQTLIDALNCLKDLDSVAHACDREMEGIDEVQLVPGGSGIDRESGRTPPAVAKDSRNAILRNRGLPVGILIGVVLGCICTLTISGLWVSTPDSPSSESPDNKLTSNQEGRPVSATNTERPAEKSEPQSVDDELTGKVTFLDTDGSTKPDSGALVIALPETRDGRLRLDGMSLRELASDSDQQSVRAALESMGVYFTRCSDSGTFQLGVHRAKNYTVVAISRHKARPEEGVIDALVDESMKLYFQSSEAIIGRLACSAVRVQRETSDAEDPKIEIQF